MISKSNTNPTASTAPLPTGSEGHPCPQCRTLIPTEGCWCPNCGLQASDPCWECGRPLFGGARFCAYCGTPTTEPAVVECPSCKAVVARGHVFCQACGEQARVACQDCERPMRREWVQCPFCGGDRTSHLRAGDELSGAVTLDGEAESAPRWEVRAPGRQSGEELNAAGARAYEAGDYQEAIRLFRQALSAEPDNARYHTNLGVAYGETGDDLQAFTAYRRAVELDPPDLAAYLNMGYLYNERERPSEAREMWEKVIALAPDSDEAADAREALENLEEV